MEKMRVSVVVKPNSKHKECVEVDGEKIVVHVKAPAMEGRANLRATDLLAKHFNRAKKNVRLLSGHRSKIKIFEIS